MNYYCLTGLPRSGSTLLRAILNQNVSIECSSTSCLLPAIQEMRGFYADNELARAENQTCQDVKLINGLRAFLNHYRMAQPSVYIDKNRQWLHAFEFLELLGFTPKMIVMVRDLRGIMASFERLYRNGQLRFPKVGANRQGNQLSIKHRMDSWADTPMRASLNHVMDAINRGLKDKLCIVRYEDFVQRPLIELARIYRYMEIPEWDHNLEDIVDDYYEEDDRPHGLEGLHDIDNKIHKPNTDWDEVLGKENAADIVRDMQQYYKEFYPELVKKEEDCGCG